MNFEELEKSIQKMIDEADISAAFEKAREKYKPLDEWREAHKEKPKNLYEAVMRKESYKAICEKVFGSY